MIAAALTIFVFIVVWALAYILLIRHWLMQYARTARLVERIEACEGGLLAKLVLWFEGKKALLVSFLMSALGALKSAADSLLIGLQPADLDPLRDNALWHAFFADDLVLKITSGLAIVAGLLAIKGHLTAARLHPKE